MRNFSIYFFIFAEKKMSFICILLLFCLLAAVTSCSRQEAPEYDSGNSERLHTLMEDLKQKKPEEAQRHMKTLNGTDNLLMNILSEYNEKNRLIREADKLLSEGNYDGLDAIISQAEADGLSSAELQQLRNLVKALHALMHFCARTPWENSQALQEGLDSLKIHLELLNASPAFVTYYNSALQELSRLQKKERDEASAALLAEMSRLLPLQPPRSQVLSILARLHENDNHHQMFRHVTSEQGRWISENSPSFWPRSPEEAYTLELAIAIAWDDAGGSTREAMLGLLSTATDLQTLSALLIQCNFSNNIADYLNCIKLWQQQYPKEKMPAFLLTRFVEVLGISGSIPLSDTPVPSPAELIDTLGHLLQKNSLK